MKYKCLPTSDGRRVGWFGFYKQLDVEQSKYVGPGPHFKIWMPISKIDPLDFSSV